MAIELDGYYERPVTGWERILHLPDRAIQSAEFNEWQAIAAERHRRLADSLYSDGARVRGGDIKIDPDSGETTLTGGALYVRGDIRGVPAATLTIPVLGMVEVGVYLTESVITDLEDPGLRNPAPGETAGFPGAARLVVSLAWGWRAADGTGGGTGAFYKVFAVTNGVLDSLSPPPQFDGVTLALAQYDRDQHSGTYGVSGFAVTPLSILDGQQVFSLSEGRAHVDGFAVAKPTATRLAHPIDPDLFALDAEPHAFVPDGTGKMRITVIYGPMATLGEVKITAQRTVTITHGAYSGAVDALPDTSVVELVSVSQGGTTYTAGSDYVRAGNAVSWAPAGAEPAPGSTYTVTYRHVTNGTVTGPDEDGFTVSGAVAGSVVYVDYVHRLPRIDRLVMDRHGAVSRVRGVADLYGPGVPPVPAGTLLLATLLQDWRGLPRVIEDGPRIMHVGEQRALSDRLDRLFDLVAADRLLNDVRAREPAGYRGVFVDNLLSNDQRDPGMAQTAAVIGGELTLPIAPTFTAPAVREQETLAYSLEAVVEQPLATGRIRVNPYDSFTPIPPTVTVDPPVDRWTVTNESWDTDSVRLIRTGHFVEGVSFVGSTTTTVDGIETLGTANRAAEYLRTIALTVTIKGLGGGEIVDAVTFDGIPVGAGLVADTTGTVVHSFAIPPNIPAGTKRIEVQPRASGRAMATFTGSGTIETVTRRRLTTVDEYHIDPVAQSFVLPAGRHIAGIDLMFHTAGTSTVVVQLRSMRGGFPGTDVLAEARRAPGQLRTDGQPTRFDWDPVWIDAAVEHAVVVLCNDAVTELAIAAVGDFDPQRQAWVTEQPYRVGVMFSSSNGTTWTPHQTEDLWFRLLAARFTASSRTIDIGTLTAAQVSDLIGLFSAERPDSTTRITLRLTGPDGRIYNLAEGQPLTLQQRITGAVQASLILEGTDIRSPVLFPGVQLVFGALTEQAAYISRQWQTPGATALRVVIDAIRPGTSGIAVAVQTSGGTWADVPLTGGTPVGDGWDEFSFVLTGYAATATRLRITLSGSALYRPRVRRIRAIAA